MKNDHKLRNKEINNSISKWAKILNNYFSKGNVEITDRYMKKINVINYQGNKNQDHNEMSRH
jgi:uncharacterized protein YbcI